MAWEYERAYLPLLLEAVTIPDDLKYWLTAAQWVEVLDKPEQEWLPPVLAALAPLGIAPTAARSEEDAPGGPGAGTGACCGRNSPPRRRARAGWC